MSAFRTEQEGFWAGDFGTKYIGRNSDPASVAKRAFYWGKILNSTRGVKSCLELGANIGLNAFAIRSSLPACQFTGVEINAAAVEQLKAIPNITAHHGSILDFTTAQLGRHDLTFTSGVLIHLNPDVLPAAYERLYECSTKYVVVIEYYNPSPVEIDYRGHTSRLFKRDFAGDLMDKYPDLQLVDYGFQYHRDPNFPADDLTWFVLKK
ncbi:pseudaminic acid biosynthesis-associated methylase [Zavarzinella formosa]|uniref:pseudaminic acid biosynthesis-associated methylase n=1 Tax=Zavarzinella formosa TaxID=360055 RepID=UPI0002D79278|nr:pseudaminic acid biosynthesis-associated methylase [Zavarzinella formosa]